MKAGDRVFVAGHRGLAGSAIVSRLEREGCEVIKRTREELDLSDQAAVYRFLRDIQPTTVILAAAKVGGIGANVAMPADFVCENLILEHNVIWGSHLADVQELLFLSSSCIYPRITPQPIPEEAFMTGKLEPTNGPYAIAKIAGLSMCENIQKQYGRNYFTVVPPNLYGPHDNFDLQNANVFPALIRKFHEAAQSGAPVEVWGSGMPKREFLASADLAEGIVFLLMHGGVSGFINLGTGIGTSIKDLAEMMQRVIGHKGEIIWDSSKPDGFPEKTLAVSRMKGMGWEPSVSLEEGIEATHAWYAANVDSGLVRCGSR